ncbi:MAG TPA: hypothetical protein VGG41_04030 [Solirubrobacteraceae bacterium]
MPATASAEARIADIDQARQVDLAARWLRFALWAAAAHYVVLFALIKLYTRVPLAVVIALGVVAVAGNIAFERNLWRRNQARLGPLLRVSCFLCARWLVGDSVSEVDFEGE